MYNYPLTIAITIIITATIIISVFKYHCNEHGKIYLPFTGLYSDCELKETKCLKK